MESFVLDVKQEPYIDVKELPYESEFVVDLDRVLQLPSSTAEESSNEDCNAPVILTWKKLSITTQDGAKRILHHLIGKITSGFYAIMVPSGWGKTTLLNTLACRLDDRTKV